MRARNDPIALDAKNRELYADYQYTATPDGYFEPTAESRNGTVFVSSQKVSRTKVLSDIAYSPTPSVTRYDEAIRNAVEGGRAVSSSEIDAVHRIVRDDGRYYVVQDSWISDPLSSLGRLALRVLLWLATVPLSVAGFVYRYG
ncbi:hypothetical protein [Haladaptatus salinisoli]|uniref:hypothetical protein n=1 Tax=Haladaptatus salinisoli TaxID=2884876 RepID=UPI001D0A3BAB|nr:hypothetical protein [Haladaptatus salinisoli]